MNATPNEAEFIKLLSQGNREAFKQLYTTYLNNLYKYIYSICYSKEISEEIVHELFLKIWENHQNLEHITAIKPYLYRAAKNLLLNHVQRMKAETRMIDIMELRAQNFNQLTDDKLIYNEYYRIAQKAISLLPEKRKQIFKLRLDDGLSLDEIALSLQISKSVVKKQLYSGISFVRKYLGKHGEIIILVLTGYEVILKNIF